MLCVVCANERITPERLWLIFKKNSNNFPAKKNREKFLRFFFKKSLGVGVTGDPTL